MSLQSVGVKSKCYVPTAGDTNQRDNRREISDRALPCLHAKVGHQRAMCGINLGCLLRDSTSRHIGAIGETENCTLGPAAFDYDISSVSIENEHNLVVSHFRAWRPSGDHWPL